MITAQQQESLSSGLGQGNESSAHTQVGESEGKRDEGGRGTAGVREGRRERGRGRGRGERERVMRGEGREGERKGERKAGREKGREVAREGKVSEGKGG